MNIKILRHNARSYQINKFDVIACLDTRANLGTPFFNDERIEKLENFDDTYTFSMSADNYEASVIEVGDFVTFKDETSKYRLFRILQIEDSTMGVIHTKTIFAENAFIDDLQSKLVAKAKLGNAYYSDAMAHILSRSGWTINKVDYMGQLKSVSFEGTTTALESLRDITNGYSGEVDAYAQLNEGGQIIGKQFDLVQNRGRKDTGKRFIYGRDIENVKRTLTNEEFYTAIKPVGKDGLTIADVNGNNDTIYDDQANQNYNQGKEHRVKIMNFEEIDNATTLLAEAKIALKKINKPKFQYEVDTALLEETTGYENESDVQLGDYVTVVDLEMIPEMTVLARIIEKRTSYANIGANKIVLGEFIELANVTPNEIKKLQGKLDNLKNGIKAAYRCQIFASNGVAIRNGVGTTDLTAKVYREGVPVFGQPHQYVWKKYDKDGTEDTAWGAANTNIGDTVYNIPAIDFINNVEYECWYLDDDYEYVTVDYFRGEIDRTIAEITKVMKPDSILIPIITDTHVATDADAQAYPIEKERVLTHHLYNFVEITNQMKFDMAVHLGDLVDGKTNNVTNQSNLKSVVNTLNMCDCPVMFTKGNHDDNGLGDIRQYNNQMNEITRPKDLKNILHTNYLANNIQQNFADNACYSYYDISNKKVRVIVLDMWDIRYDMMRQTTSNGKKITVNMYPSKDYGGFQNTQIQWLINVLMSTPLDTKVIICAHSGLKSVFNVEDDIFNNEIVTGIINSWQDGTHFTNTGIDKNYPTKVDVDFSNRGKGQLIAAFAGHKHLDTAKRQGLGNAPTILTTCNVAPLDKNGYVRKTATKDEDAFDIAVINPSENYKIHMVRFGANSDVRPVRSYESGL